MTKCKHFFFCCILLAAAGLSVSCAKEAKNVSHISVSHIQQMTGNVLDDIMQNTKDKENYLVIDVREPDEYDQGHVRYAINISVREIATRLKEIEDFKQKNVIVLCRSGKRSQKAAEILVANGFSKVFNAEGVAVYDYSSKTGVHNIRGKQLQEFVDSGAYSIVDAREERDYDISHLKGAIYADIDSLEEKIGLLPKDKPVAVYCYAGNRSFQVAEKLHSLGYTVYNSLDGTTEYDDFVLVRE